MRIGVAIEHAHESEHRLFVSKHCMVFFRLAVFSEFDRYKFYVCESYFHAESISASPMIIACNSGELFLFFTRLFNVNVL